MQSRAELYHRIRAYFARQAVLEVEVPLLGRSTALDPHLDSFRLGDEAGRWLYLQTSPELFMKRLLASGSGSIFSITKAFRMAEQGRLHNPEFSLLEWYRLAMDLDELALDVAALLEDCLGHFPFRRLDYGETFQAATGLCPHSCSDEQLIDCAHGWLQPGTRLGRSDALDLLMSEVVEPGLEAEPVFLFHFPACQAAMSEIAERNGHLVALRFELYINGVEIANGYQELRDYQEQIERFEKDKRLRQQMHKTVPEVDHGYLKALQNGLPYCSGVALGLDRLLAFYNPEAGADSGFSSEKAVSVRGGLLFPWDTL